MKRTVVEEQKPYTAFLAEQQISGLSGKKNELVIATSKLLLDDPRAWRDCCLCTICSIFLAHLADKEGRLTPTDVFQKSSL